VTDIKIILTPKFWVFWHRDISTNMNRLLICYEIWFTYSVARSYLWDCFQCNQHKWQLQARSPLCNQSYHVLSLHVNVTMMLKSRTWWGQARMMPFLKLSINLQSWQSQIC